MKVTYHSQLRYVQRVIGIEDEIEAQAYLKDNECQIKNILYEYICNTDHLQYNFVNNTVTNKCVYFIIDRIIFVCSSSKSELITLYKIKESITDNVLKNVDYQIKKNNKKVKELKNTMKYIGKDSDRFDFIIDYLKKQLTYYIEQREDYVKHGKEVCKQCCELNKMNHKLLWYIQGKL